MITFKFNEKKTTQAAAILIKKHGNTLNYTKLIKLLYIADREALSRWERPITGDSYVSMKHGPVLSNVFDLIDYEDDSYWHTYISKNVYDVTLKTEPDSDELSKRELDLLDLIYDKFRNNSWREMIDICHDVLPEWDDPGSTSQPIRVEDILKAVNKTELEIDIIQSEISNMGFIKKVLNVSE